MPRMKFYASTACKGSMYSRRISSRTVVVLALLIGTIFPFLFVRIALLILESAAISTCSLDCIRWRPGNGNVASPSLRDELTRAFMEASGNNAGGEIRVPKSFGDLVKEARLKKEDLNTFAVKTREMLSKMEGRVQSARKMESIYWNIASHGIPNSMHCFSLQLAEEYAINSEARARLPAPEFVSRLSDASFHHVVIFTDNVLAASVVIVSIVGNSPAPEKLVLHVLTDKKTYAPMHAWFSLNSVSPAVLEVKGLHQLDWSAEVVDGVGKIKEIDRRRQSRRQFSGEVRESFRPSSLNLMNHLRMFLPQLFPDLNRVVLLDDDVVVQRDLSPLWELDLAGEPNGAVSTCPDTSEIGPDACWWLPGMNVFDLQAWRSTNITAAYIHWLELNDDSGHRLSRPGFLLPTLLAFRGRVRPLGSWWHVSGLGRNREFWPESETIRNGTVLHFDGPAKPWLEIGFPENRNLWYKHVNSSNRFIRRCRIVGS